MMSVIITGLLGISYSSINSSRVRLLRLSILSTSPQREISTVAVYQRLNKESEKYPSRSQHRISVHTFHPQRLDRMRSTSFSQNICLFPCSLKYKVSTKGIQAKIFPQFI